ncbi:MAG: helicase-related protein [Bacillota bacterium]
MLNLPNTEALESVTTLHGVGPARARALGDLGVGSIGELLVLMPRRYEDWRCVHPYGAATRREIAAVRGRILSTSHQRYGVSRTRIEIGNGRERARGFLFGRRGFEGNLRRSRPIILRGRWRNRRADLVESDSVEVEFGPRGEVRPIYPASSAISSNMVGKLIKTALDDLDLSASFPHRLAHQIGHGNLRDVLEAIHRPRRPREAERGLWAMAFLDMLMFQLALHRFGHRPQTGFSHADSGELTDRYRRDLPFEFTGEQETAIGDIARDMASRLPMYRLLQGDVATGKTVVAIWATLRAVENGGRAVWLVPTRLLADQHVATLKNYLDPLGIEVSRLTSGDPKPDQDVVVGTHALIRAEIDPITLLVVDEQQRFGVKQRRQLEETDPSPDVLLMSATPIPRTLARCMWGDLQVSTLRSRAGMRRRVRTRVLPSERREDLYRYVVRAGREGVGTFVICPTITGNEEDPPWTSAERWSAALAKRMSSLRIACIHGSTEDEQKDRLLREFRDGGIDVLVTTNVVGVGIDIPRARFMIVEAAERFGLTQLHQLRGRIGRDGRRALFAPVVSEDRFLERISVLEEIRDGFSISRVDLKRRGMGDFFSRAQHGGPPFLLPEMSTSSRIMMPAARMARNLVRRDPRLVEAENVGLAALLRASYPEDNPWVDVR